ncbi:MAG: Rpn family recombination-promoting nuclease/putative transposase [Chloroflexota bacterium]
MRKLITFDWATKRILRDKANFDILEGFLSELLRQEIRIQEILESESNKETDDDKSNIVDLLVENDAGELIIIEVQHEREWDYLQRMLYGTSKLVAQYISQGDPFSKIKKVISVNIVYFDLGRGDDYIYHGKTEFVGLRKGSPLELSAQQRLLYAESAEQSDSVSVLFPEYFLLKVEQFDDIIRDPLDEWIYFLKHEEIRNDFEAKGLGRAKETLDVLKLPEEDRRSYEQYLKNLHYEASLVESNYKLGQIEGRAEGRTEGQADERIAIARRMLDASVDHSLIADVTQLTLAEISELQMPISGE